jgi:4-hydroxyphenylpyruvate dioxygenase
MDGAMKNNAETTATITSTSRPESTLGFDGVEFYVGNAHQAAHYLRTGFGLQPLCMSGLDTGDADSTRVLLGGTDVRFIVTSGLCRGPIADHVHRHGDAVRDIAIRVADVDSVFERAVQNGATPLLPPTLFAEGDSPVRKAMVGTPGDLVHSLVQRDAGPATLLPNGKLLGTASRHELGFTAIDHIAIAVDAGCLDAWVDYYCSAFGFELTHEETTSTELTAMRSKVVENASRTVKFPIVEPARGRKRSQVEDFLHYNDGPGVQHVAVSCEEIGVTVRALRARGIEFLNVPDSYYDLLPTRFGQHQDQFEPLRESRVLVDRDEWGYLLQTLSKPISGRPTVFFELVERKGARGFGSGNIKALFEALEREQSLRSDWSRS